MMTIPEFRSADRRRSLRFLAAATGAVLLVTGGWLAVVYAFDAPGPPFDSEWLGLFALVPVFAAYTLAVWAADRWAGRIACPSCRAVVTQPTRLVVDRCCGRCRTPMLASPEEPDISRNALVDVAAAVKRETDREAWRGTAIPVAGLLAGAAVVEVSNKLQWPGWLTAVLCGLVIGGGIAAAVAFWHAVARRNPLVACPHCRAFLFALDELRRTGRCGTCGRTAVSDLPAGVASPAPAG